MRCAPTEIGGELLGWFMEAELEATRKVYGVLVSDAAGTQLDSYFVERITVNTGTACHGSRLGGQPARRAGIDASTVERVGWGGVAVVVRGRESRPHGEGRQRF